MNKDKWGLSRRIEIDYANAIQSILEGFEQINSSDPFSIVRDIAALARSPTFQEAAQKIAHAMATHLFADNNRTWRAAAREGSKGRTIYESLQADITGTALGMRFNNIIDANAAYISSLPLEIAGYMNKRIASNMLVGRRADEMVADLLRYYPHITRTRAQLIARTETSKAQSALTRSRAESIGINWYEWRTSGDGRVRDSHRHMDRVLVWYNEPPSPETLINKKSHGRYNAGDIWNCRCYAAPLVDASDVSWPHKVYANDQIKTMTLAQFRQLES